MASPTRFMSDFLLPFAKEYNKSMLDSNKPINAIKEGLAQRFFSSGRVNTDLLKAVNGKVRRGRNLEFDYKGQKKGTLVKDDTVNLSDYQLAKSAFYNKQGRLQHSRVAGAAIGFGGGAIAGLNLAGDMMFDG